MVGEISCITFIAKTIRQQRKD